MIADKTTLIALIITAIVNIGLMVYLSNKKGRKSTKEHIYMLYSTINFLDNGAYTSNNFIWGTKYRSNIF